VGPARGRRRRARSADWRAGWPPKGRRCERSEHLTSEASFVLWSSFPQGIFSAFLSSGSRSPLFPRTVAPFPSHGRLFSLARSPLFPRTVAPFPSHGRLFSPPDPWGRGWDIKRPIGKLSTDPIRIRTINVICYSQPVHMLSHDLFPRTFVVWDLVLFDKCCRSPPLYPPQAIKRGTKAATHSSLGLVSINFPSRSSSTCLFYDAVSFSRASLPLPQALPNDSPSR